LFGGVSQTEIVIAFVLMSVTAFMLGTLGSYFSANEPACWGQCAHLYGGGNGGGGGACWVSLVLTILGIWWEIVTCWCRCW
jgi:hypothetical protein